ncbi:MAG: class I SAM-dependent methyltransferase [Solobacterium sp.]|nr:class I SAM-dependent methyltransferase [Solobacterium sp.]
MNEVNRTLYIPLYGKALVSRRNMILEDPDAERIWAAEGFAMHGKAKSVWLAYNMAMRARVFDDWTDEMLRQHPDALVLHIGCGLDSRFRRVRQPYVSWYDCDLEDVIRVRREYWDENARYHMTALDASDPAQISQLPERPAVIVIMEGLSMYLTNPQVHDLLSALHRKYAEMHVLMDVYTRFGADASKFKNPIHDVGASRVYGISDINALISGTGIRLKMEHSFTPEFLINELRPSEQRLFRLMFVNRMYGKIYRLFELEG